MRNIASERLRVRTAPIELCRKNFLVTGKLAELEQFTAHNNPIFSTSSQAVLKYHVAMTHSRVPAKSTKKCQNCLEEFSGFLVLRNYRGSQHRVPFKTSNFDKDTLLQDICYAELEKKHKSCKQFFVDSEFETGTQMVFNFAISSFNESFLNKKLDHEYNQLRCATKVKLALEFVQSNIESGTFSPFLTKTKQVWRGLHSCTHKIFWQMWRGN